MILSFSLQYYYTDLLKTSKGFFILKPKNYINNKTLYVNMIQHKEKLRLARENNQEKPVGSRYIGDAILLICNNLMKRPNFSGYSPQWKQEMISDATIDCVAAIDNFDPDKTNNPFAYFTQIAWNAFIRRLHKEKKQSYIKHKNFQNSYILEDWWDDQHHSLQLKNSDFSDEIIRNFENNLTKVKKPTKLVGLEKFITPAEEIKKENIKDE